MEITLDPSSFEIFSFVPIKKLGRKTIRFAPIGLENMFNSGGTVLSLGYVDSGSEVQANVGGSFVAYSSGSPRKCLLNGSEVPSGWSSDRKLVLNLPWNEDSGGISDLVFVF